ncbi:MAG TPA: ABC transporter permease, partial [Clostridia bacterium]|nr:ABC transporter permease [Clostridia bacterium]
MNTKKRSQARDIWRRFCRNKLSVAALVILCILVLMAVFADILADYDTLAVDQNIASRLQPPGSEHLFGTDEYGRDVFARILHGARVSLTIGFAVVAISTVVAAILGGVAGYFGNRIDNIIMRVADMFISIPPVLLCLAIVAALGVGITNLMIALIIALIPGNVRLVRSAVLSVKDMEYVEAAAALGLSKRRIITKYILTNCMAPILVNATMSIGEIILTAAGLSFIGLGIKPPMP